jgi:uncharacterized protein
MQKPPEGRTSFFLFGPRGTGKTWWVRDQFADALYVDLLHAGTRTRLAARPERLEELIPDGYDGWTVIDEVQKVPDLLNEVHRLIEHKGYRFVLTGSSARSLRRKGVNLLAGRALLYHMHPLTAPELGDDFKLQRSLAWGHLPATQQAADPRAYLESYVLSYLREEVQQEGLTRDLGAFSRFLEIASLSQGQILNYTQIGRECALGRKTVEGYFSLTEDLLLAHRLPVFTRRAKRRLVAHPKFYFFDVGIYQILRPRGPLDTTDELNGVGLESLVLQEIRALNDILRLEYKLFYWRTGTGSEVDIVLYGANGFHAIEVKCSSNVGPRDLRGLKAFGTDYPEAQLTLIYGGNREEWHHGIRCIPASQALIGLSTFLTRARDSSP